MGLKWEIGDFAIFWALLWAILLDCLESFKGFRVRLREILCKTRLRPGPGGMKDEDHDHEQER